MILRQADSLERERKHEILRQVATELRNSSSQLRPPMLDDLGLAAALEWLVSEALKVTSITIRSDCSQLEEELRLPPEMETALFRIAQEALTNALKHSSASSVSISLCTLGDELMLQVSDDGQGFSPESRSTRARQRRLGLLGIEERVSAANGTLLVESAKGKGTAIRVRLPIQEGR